MRSGVRFAFALSVTCLALAPSLTAAEAFRIEPFKDELFAYPSIAASAYGGDHLTVPFSYERDVVARDVQPDEKTRPEYVDLDVVSSPQDLVLRRDGQTVRYVGVGRVDGNAKVVTIFVHGLGATRFDGLNDWRSGGNLNRIKNLMVRNDGAYLSMDYSSFPSKGRKQIAAMVSAVAEASPGAPIFLVCASIGARPCWRFAESSSAAAHVSGIFMVAPVNRPGFAKKRRGQGSGAVDTDLHHTGHPRQKRWLETPGSHVQKNQGEIAQLPDQVCPLRRGPPSDTAPDDRLAPGDELDAGGRRLTPQALRCLSGSSLLSTRSLRGLVRRYFALSRCRRRRSRR